MKKWKFYDKPDGDDAAEFKAWQCGYRRASVNGLLVVVWAVQFGIMIGQHWL